MNKAIVLSLALCCCCICGFAQQKLTLEQCLDSALKYNHDLHIAEQEIVAAKEQKKEAYTKYFPQIQANALAFQFFERLVKKNDNTSGSFTLADLFTSETDISILDGMRVDYNSSYSMSGISAGYVGTISAIQPLFMGGRIINGNKLANVGIDAAELKHVIKEKDVLQMVTECFWKLATVKYNLNTIEAAEKQIAEVKTRVQNLVDNGVITSNAILQVNLREHELASTRLKLENGDELLRLLLAQQIGITKGKIDIVVPNDMEQPNLPAYAGEGSSDTRAELELASKGIEAEKLRLKIEKGKLLPTLAIGVAGLAFGHNFDDIHGNINGSISIPQLQEMGYSAKKDFNRDWSLSDKITQHKFTGLAMATLSIPISDWWGGTHAVRRQKARLSQAEETYQDAKEKLALDNESAWLKLIEAYKQIGIARASVEQSEENLRMHTDQYENGTITITDVLDAETLNRKAHNQLSTSIADYNVRLADYQRKVIR